MDKEGTANDRAESDDEDDEGMASKEEAVDEGELFMEGESSQGQYYHSLGVGKKIDIAIYCCPLCCNK